MEELEEEDQKMSDEEISRNSPLGGAQVAAGLAPASVASSLSQSQNNNIYAKAQEALRAHYQHMGLMMTRFSDLKAFWWKYDYTTYGQKVNTKFAPALR